MMSFKDIPRVLKGLITAENISDDEIRTGISFLVILVILFLTFLIII